MSCFFGESVEHNEAHMSFVLVPNNGATVLCEVAEFHIFSLPTSVSAFVQRQDMAPNVGLGEGPQKSFLMTLYT